MAKKIKKKKIVRHSEKPKTPLLNFFLCFFRFMLYGMIGVFSEVSLYSIVKICRKIPIIRIAFNFDWKVDDSLNLNGIWDVPIKTFFGQCSLWMFLVYGICGFFVIELIYKKNYHKSWIIRGSFYALSILVFEFFSGFALNVITGYEIWYYNDKLNLLHMTSLYTLPMWFVTGMLVETLYRELMQKELKDYIQKEIDERF